MCSGGQNSVGVLIEGGEWAKSGPLRLGEQNEAIHAQLVKQNVYKERNNQILTGSERLERILMWENGMKKDGHVCNRPPCGDTCYHEIIFKKQVHKLAEMM